MTLPGKVVDVEELLENNQLFVCLETEEVARAKEVDRHSSSVFFYLGNWANPP